MKYAVRVITLDNQSCIEMSPDTVVVEYHSSYVIALVPLKEEEV